jgi:hypothetical protein
VRGIDAQVARERPAQSFVSGDQGTQTLVDLPIQAFPPLLNGNHRQQANADANQCDNRKAQESSDERMQRAEIEIAQ